MKSCYLCNREESALAHKGTRDNKDIDVLRCANCGLVYLSDDSHITDSFYEESGMTEYEDVYADSFRESQTDAMRRFDFLRERITNKTLLDYGCGNGSFLKLAGNVCKTAHRLELDSHMREHINLSGDKCFKDLQSAISEGNKYDVITMFHVIEHFKNPVEDLKRISALSSSANEIIVETPNADDALLLLYPNTAFPDFTYWSCHLYLYNQQTLRTVLERAGFKVNYVRQIQRYSVSNHLYWLANSAPGGHKKWNFLNSPGLSSEYESVLRSVGACDTLIASVSTH